MLTSCVGSWSALLVLSVRCVSGTSLPQHRTTRQQARDAESSSLRHILELDAPTLTVNAQSELTLTDGTNTFENFQKAVPVCQQALIDYVFANSYGAPVMGQHLRPPCRFNRVVWNLTVTSNGTQLDRLGTLWLGDIEVLRTSTAEPAGYAINWTYLKVQ